MNLIEILTQLRKGKCVIDAQSKLQEVVKQCRDTGKSGELTLKLKIKPGAKGEMIVTGMAEGKLPKADVTGNLFYDDQDGLLLREDPKQTAMEFESAENDNARTA
jgi:hypothetical protein